MIVKRCYHTLLIPTDECLVSNGGCDQICNDTAQSYECSCNTGYTLDSDGRACNGIHTTYFLVIPVYSFQ